MEGAIARPPGVVDPATVADVAQAYQATGPFVTVYLTTEPAVENAAQRDELRWRNLRQELADQGAPERALAAIDPLVPDAHRQGRTLAAAVSAEGLSVVRHEPEPPARDVVSVAPLPRLGTVLEWEQAAIPHLVVLADRAGADIVVVRRSGDEDIATVGADRGDDPELRRNQPGGWSQRRYQQRAENLWEERAEEVAQEVCTLAGKIGARLVVVAGDVRAIQLLRQELPREVGDLVREISGGRSPDGSEDAVAAETVRLAASVAAEDTVACMQRLKEQAGRGALAAEGIEATLAALREARVDVLLVDDDPDDEREAFFAAEPNLVATDATVLKELGATDVTAGRLVDVALRAAFGTGAGVRIVPGTVPEGIAALLRY